MRTVTLPCAGVKPNPRNITGRAPRRPSRRGVESHRQLAHASGSQNRRHELRPDARRQQKRIDAYAQRIIAAVKALDTLDATARCRERHLVVLEQQRPLGMGIGVCRPRRGYNLTREGQDGSRARTLLVARIDGEDTLDLATAQQIQHLVHRQYAAARSRRAAARGRRTHAVEDIAHVGGQISLSPRPSSRPARQAPQASYRNCHPWRRLPRGPTPIRRSQSLEYVCSFSSLHSIICPMRRCRHPRRRSLASSSYKPRSNNSCSRAGC